MRTAKNKMALAPAPTGPVEVSSAMLEITPAMAEEWLKSSPGNRPIGAATVAKYASIMKEGRWSQTHQGIAFDEIGSLIDGHHRLRAIVQANVPITMQVTYGVARTTFAAIDTMRVRTLSQGFGSHGVKDHGKTSTLVRVLWFLQHGQLLSANKQLDTPLLLAFYEENKEEISWALKYRKSGDAASVLPALAYAHAKAPVNKKVKIGLFADKLVSGANLPDGSAPLLLRNWLATMPRKSSTKDRNEIIKRTFAALCMWLDGRTGSQLRSAADPFEALHDALASS